MSDRRRPHVVRQQMAMHGATVAWALCAGVGGVPEEGTGWRGALQAAATIAEDDEEVLRIADEVYALSHLLIDRAAVRTYAEATRPTVQGAPATSFLEGMIGRVA
jgi:hypothetical protein